MSGSKQHPRRTCTVCKKQFDADDVVPAAAVRDTIGDLIARSCPEWDDDSWICREDLARFRNEYVHELLESEKGDLTSLEQEVIQSLRDHELLTTNVDEEFAEHRTLGQMLADRIADFGGSWTFLILFGSFLVLWIAANSLLLIWHPVDPYPFILLNLVLSCLAAVQAPIIMMSQNRQEARDRKRAQHDYKVNLKAELEIRQLHEKVDHLLSQQWERLVKIQEIQIELLSELRRSQGS